MRIKTDYDGLEILSSVHNNVPDNDGARMIFTILSGENLSKILDINKAELIRYIPEIGKMIGYNQNNPNLHLDLWNHTLVALENSVNNFEVRMALLLHDISKPDCCVVKDDRSYYPGHNKKSSEMAREILTRLGWDGEIVNTICDIIAVHDKPLTQEFAKNNFELSKKRNI